MSKLDRVLTFRIGWYRHMHCLLTSSILFCCWQLAIANIESVIGVQLQKDQYRHEKKRTAQELVQALKDPSVVVMADWLKVRGTLRKWSRFYCVLKPGILLIYKSPKTHKANLEFMDCISMTRCFIWRRVSFFLAWQLGRDGATCRSLPCGTSQQEGPRRHHLFQYFLLTGSHPILYLRLHCRMVSASNSIIHLIAIFGRREAQAVRC